MENLFYALEVHGSQILSGTSTTTDKKMNPKAKEKDVFESDQIVIGIKDDVKKGSYRKVFPVLDPADENERSVNLEKVIETFEEHLKESVSNYLGCPANQSCSHLTALSPLLQYHINNIGDPFNEGNHVLNTKMFEVGALDWCAQLWEIEKNDYWGYVTNGGTEGNLYGLLIGRELLQDGIMYTSAESHYSIFKIARMYRMDCETISTTPSGEMDYHELRKKLLINKERSAIINVIAGTTFKGALENLDIIIQTLKDCGFSQNRFYIHCDAALSGFVVPFLGHPKYTFKKPIGSVSISGHKFMGSPMPCGVVLTREKYKNVISKKVEYIDTIDTTISGSRNGHAPLFLWYTMSIKGRKGLEREVETCLKNARSLKNRLRNAGISAMLNEGSFVVVFERPLDGEFVRYWQLQCFKNAARVVVMPHVTTQMLDRFFEDLIERRKTWYGDGKSIMPPCLAEEIGVSNCACPVHGFDLIYEDLCL